MVNPENSAFILPQPKFEPYPRLKDIDKAPETIVALTDQFIDMAGAGILSPNTTRDYLATYTRPFLRNAARGVERVYEKNPMIVSSLPIEVSEAADFAKIIFSWMHYYAKSQYLPDGFSRRGVLRAPQNRAEFVARILEINEGLYSVENGEKIKGKSFMSDVRAFRTYTFFKVGGRMPIKFSPSEKETKEREADLLNSFDLMWSDSDKEK